MNTNEMPKSLVQCLTLLVLFAIGYALFIVFRAELQVGCEAFMHNPSDWYEAFRVAYNGFAAKINANPVTSLAIILPVCTIGFGLMQVEHFSRKGESFGHFRREREEMKY